MRKFWMLGTMLIAMLTVYQAPVLVSAAARTLDSSNVTVKDIQGPSITQALSHRVRKSWPWYLARASGMLAAVTLVLLMLSGIGQITGKTYRFLEPLTAWATHRALGLTFAIAVLVHMLSLLFDTFVPFGILQLLVPWLSDYRPIHLFGVPVGSLYVALGVLSFYGVAAIVITSFVWVEKKPYLWKCFHLLSYLVLVFAYIHALYLGTDLSHGIFRTIWLLIGLLLGVTVLLRLWRARTI